MERNHTLDTLRSLAAALIVLLHSSTKWFYTLDFGKVDFALANVLSSFTRIGTPLFLMISGAFLLGKNGQESLVEFYRKRYAKIFIPLLVWSVAGIVTRVWIAHKFPRQLVLDIFNGQPIGHLWFLYMLIGLYAVTPFLDILVSQLPRRTLWITAWLVLAANSISSFYGYEMFFVFNWINFVGYFLIGYLIKTSDRNFSSMFLIGGYLLATMANILLSYYTPIKFGDHYFDDRLSPFVVVGALCVFTFFCRQQSIKPNLLSKLVPYSMGIYLIHPFFFAIMEEFNLIPDTAFPGIFLLFTVSYTGSLFITWTLTKVKYLRRIV
jgi:surface polysaccharide O-acyltransferase-like enzyme